MADMDGENLEQSVPFPVIIKQEFAVLLSRSAVGCPDPDGNTSFYALILVAVKTKTPVVP
jgi:hypothetical protein